MVEDELAVRARDVAFSLFAAGQPLGAAVFFVQSIRHGEHAQTWAELGCALQDCAGLMVRSPFFESAELAFARADDLGLGGPMVPVVAERRALHRAELGKHLPGVSRVSAGADRFLALATPGAVPPEALAALEAFLMVNDGVVVEALDALPSGERSGALALAAQLGWAHLSAAVEAARSGRWGAEEAGAAAHHPLPPDPQRLPELPDPHADLLGAASGTHDGPEDHVVSGSLIPWAVLAGIVLVGAAWLALG